MNDFLSNLIERNLTDKPEIRPRVPSLFEPTTVDFFDEQRASTSSAISEWSPGQETATANSPGSVTDLPKEHLPTPSTQRTKTVSAEIVQEIKHVVVPSASSAGEKDRSNGTREDLKNSSKAHAAQSLRPKDFSPVDQRSSRPAPIIRVTIGRVEVRAVQSPAPSPKPAKPRQPKLSLEEYLRKRQGGSR